MKMKFPYLFLNLFLIGMGFLIASFTSAVNEEDCLKQVRELYQQLNDQARSMKSGVYYLNYQVTTQMNKKGAIPTQSEVEVYSNKHRVFVISDQMEIYRDAKAQVHVMPLQKKIFLYDGVKVDDKALDNGLKKQMMVSDSLFAYCKVEHCGFESTNEIAVRKIKLKVSEMGVKKFHIANLNFTLDKAGKSIKECVFQYDPKYPVKETRTVIKQCSYNYQTNKLDKSSLEIVFKGDNSLQDRFKGFTVIDNRNNQITKEQKQVAYTRMKQAAGNQTKESKGNHK